MGAPHDLAGFGFDRGAFAGMVSLTKVGTLIREFLLRYIKRQE